MKHLTKIVLNESMGYFQINPIIAPRFSTPLLEEKKTTNGLL